MTTSNFSHGLLPEVGAIASSSRWSRPLLTLAHPKGLTDTAAVSRSSWERCSRKSPSSDALPGRQWLTGSAKNRRRRALPRIYFRKGNSAFGLPCSFCKIHVLQADPAAEPGKACQHSTASCLYWDLTGDASSSKVSLERTAPSRLLFP